jgi:hypothetical protein
MAAMAAGMQPVSNAILCIAVKCDRATALWKTPVLQALASPSDLSMHCILFRQA